MRASLIKFIVLIIVVGLAFIVSSITADKLDRTKVIDQQRTVNKNCDNEINGATGMTYNLGECEYLLTKLGWPLTVEKQYTFLAIEKPNTIYNFTVDPTAKDNKEIEYMQLSSQFSDPEFTCNSKGCLFSSDNQFLVFVLLILFAPAIYLLGNNLRRRSTG